jgi:methionyl-tRNA formyltransferase
MDAAIGVLAAYGKIVPQSVIDIFPHGIINIHPSDLPRHRGPIPIESVILNGETRTAVSIMRLVKDMDAGPVYGRAEVELVGTESKQELADHLLDIGGAMVVELLPGILDGNLVAVPQDHVQATYDELITKADGELDFSKPAERLEREVRAYLGWPQSRTKLGDKDVIITAAHAVPSTMPEGQGHIEVLREGGVIMINTSDGYLCIDRLKPAGKSDMTAKAFLAGYSV